MTSCSLNGSFLSRACLTSCFVVFPVHLIYLHVYIYMFLFISAEFEGLGVGDANGASVSHNDEDMNELFRSFLGDGDDMLTVSSSQGNHSTGSHSSGPPSSLTPPSGFHLRVSTGAGGGAGGLGSGSSGGGRFGGGGGGGGAGGAGGYDGNGGGMAGLRRRANTSPECEDMVPSSIPSSAQVRHPSPFACSLLSFCIS